MGVIVKWGKEYPTDVTYVDADDFGIDASGRLNVMSDGDTVATWNEGQWISASIRPTEDMMRAALLGKLAGIEPRLSREQREAIADALTQREGGD